MPLLLMLWCNVVKRNWIIILMQTVLGVIAPDSTAVSPAISIPFLTIQYLIQQLLTRSQPELLLQSQSRSL